MAEVQQTKAPLKKFDPKRAHGTVYGHLSVKHEQDGVLFGANGYPVQTKQLEIDEEKLAAEVAANDEARSRELRAKS
jgi:hypothetical protein